MQWIKPMLATAGNAVPQGQYAYEVKWDGIRTILAVSDRIQLYSRSGRDISSQFPELTTAQLQPGVYDGEIYCLRDGKPDLGTVMQKLNANTPNFDRANCCLFDRLAIDGKRITSQPWYDRRESLEDGFDDHPNYHLSELFQDGENLLEGIRKMQMEGIMSKRIDGRYIPGRRSNAWIKNKIKKSMKCYIVNHTEGRGMRKNSFGSLHLTDDAGQYIGRVGTGFDYGTIAIICDRLQSEDAIPCKIQYTYKTERGLREPVFLNLS